MVTMNTSTIQKGIIMSNKKHINPVWWIAVSFIMSLPTFAEVVVIVHPSNSAALDAKTVQRIFLGKAKQYSDGTEALPINQTNGSASRSSFDQDLLGRSSNQVSAYWSKQVFTGQGVPPKEVADDAAVIAIIAKNENAIGYADKSAVTGDVKVVTLN